MTDYDIALMSGNWDALEQLCSNPEEVEAKMREIPYFSFK